MTFDEVLAAVRELAGRRVSIAVGRGDARLAGFAGRLMGERRAEGDGLPPGAVVFPVVPEGASAGPGGEYGVLVLSKQAFERGEWRDSAAHGRALELDHGRRGRHDRRPGRRRG